MGASIFNEMELDAIGEIMNISLGASATAVSTMLGTTVNITTPVVSVLTREEFEFRRLEPAIGVEIDYVEGLDGKNIMMFRREDVGIIVGTMLGEEPPYGDIELDEIHISAICEVMNQMMGASATALSEFLGTVVNISTPKSFDVGDPADFKVKYFPEKDGMVVVRFRLEIEGKLNSEFMNIMSTALTKRLLEPFADSLAQAAPEPAPQPAPAPATSSGGSLSQEEINAMLAGASSSAPAPSSSGGGSLSQEEINAMLAGTASSTPAPAPAASSGGSLSQEEINAMLAGASSSTPAPAPAASSGGTMPQEEINAMLAGAASSTPASSSGGSMSQEEINAMLAGAASSAPVVAPTPQPAPGMQPAAGMGQPYYPYPPMGTDPMMLQLFTQMQQTQMQMMEMMKAVSAPQPAPAPAPQPSSQSSGGTTIIRPMAAPSIRDEAGDGEEDKANQEMLMKVPLEISVEIGRTKRLVRDILEFTQGTLVVLDKMAGEQVDLFVNGQCIAKGDIVVVEDNFGIRITEIVTRELHPEVL